VSSLFRRLAERATGQRRPVLHAPVLLPYAGVPEWLPETEALALTPAVAPAVPPDSDPVFSPATPLTSTAPALDRSEPQKTASGWPLAPPIEVPYLQASPSITSFSETIPESLIKPEPQVDSERSTPASAYTLPLPESERPRQTPTLEVPHPPPPLLPLPPLYNQQSQPVAVSSPQQPRADEIHVHIGRIEVTAVHEAAPAKHSARKPQPSLSLDDYLARRRGEKK